MIFVFCLEVMVYQMTQSKGMMGSVIFAFAFPAFLLRLIGAPLIDRFDRVKIILVLNIVRSCTISIFFIVSLTDYIAVWQFFVICAILGSCAAWFLPAGMALLPNLLKKEQLVRGYSLLETSTSMATLLGPIIGGTLVGWSGPEVGIGFYAGILMIGSFLNFLLSRQRDQFSNPLEIPSNQGTSWNWRQFAQEWKRGFTFFRYVPALVGIMSLLAISNFCFATWHQLLVPLGIEVLHVNIRMISFLGPSMSLGVMCGAFITTWIGDIQARSKMMTGSFVLTGLVVLGISFSDNYWITLFLFFLFGVSIPFFNSYSSSIFGQLVPDAYRGRVMSVRLLIGQGLVPIGNITGGWVSEAIGLPPMLMMAGILTIIAGVIGLAIPLLKQIDGNLDGLQQEIKKNLEGAALKEVGTA
jgi:MFS family permease